MVKLPTKHNDVSKLCDTRWTALNSLKKAESLDKEVLIQYRLFMSEYFNLGHMSKFLDPDFSPTHNYSIPHRAVLCP